MRPKRLISTVIAMHLLWLIAGCCSSEHTSLYEWNGLDAVHLDNGGRIAVESSRDSLAASAYGIRVKLGTRWISSLLSPLPTACATSCVEEYTYINRDTVLALRVDAMAPDTTIPPRDVTAEFIASAVPELPGQRTDGTFIGITDLVRDLNRQRSAPFNHIDLIRSRSIERSDGIRFIVTITLSGGKVLADTTSPIALL